MPPTKENHDSKNYLLTMRYSKLQNPNREAAHKKQSRWYYNIQSQKGSSIIQTYVRRRQSNYKKECQINVKANSSIPDHLSKILIFSVFQR